MMIWLCFGSNSSHFEFCLAFRKELKLSIRVGLGIGGDML